MGVRGFREDDLKRKHVSVLKKENKKRRFNETWIADFEEAPIRLPNPMIGYGVPSEQPTLIHRSLPKEARGPPYF